MALMHDYEGILALLNEWRTKATLRPTDPIEDVLRDILGAHGTALSSEDISIALGGAMHGVMPDAARFTNCIVALLGDPDLRLRHAFGAFTTDAAGTIRKSDFEELIHVFSDQAVDAGLLADEIDADGDGRIALEDFAQYLADWPETTGAYRASHLPAHHIGTGPRRPLRSVPASTSSKPLAQDDDAGLSPLQFRIGFFRLMQGAAYRSFRANYAANSQTHLRARDLPYTIEDFARFTTAAIDFYLSLGLVTDPGCVAEFQRLDQIVQDEVARLHARISDWQTLPKSPEMAAAQAGIAAERDDLDYRRDLCRAVIELVLALRMNGLSLDRAGAKGLAHHEINRLRHAELRAENHGASAVTTGHNASYLDTWNRVIVSAADEWIDGAIMPTRFWYDTFMPQLLLCASLTTENDLRAAHEATEQDLDAWHRERVAKGDFDPFATDLRDKFSVCSRDMKLSLKQAWELTAPYLVGIEKRRERKEFGRDTGSLSEYVAFIDVPLGRNDVETAEMRLSFPYFIGPAVWGLLHGAAELVEAMQAAARSDAVKRFATFFRTFATMYPCPYCRYHLNRYVIRNGEVGMYPVEFVILGHKPGRHDLAITLDDKLATIAASGGLRRFLWMLHNAVSASIARTEPWYHLQPNPLYTSRFWPGIEAELGRAAALGHATVTVERVNDIFQITKAAAHLAVLQYELGHVLTAGDDAAIARMIDRAEPASAELTKAVEQTAYLTRTYALNRNKNDSVVPVSASQEALARSGLFVER